MLDIKQELVNYPAINLEILEKSISNISDSMRNSIILYNKALDNLKMNSEDIAIIELKKAISINPNFHEAMNLLGLCYTYIKDYEKAAELFNKVIAAENNSVKALKYLDTLNMDGTNNDIRKNKKKKKVAVQVKENLSVNPFLGVNNLFNFKNTGTREIVRYALSFACGALAIFIIYTVFSFPDNKAVGVLSQNDLPESTPSAVTADEKEDYEKKYNNLAEEKQVLQEEFDKAIARLDYYNNVSKLLSVDNMVRERNFEAAAEQLLWLSSIEFTGAEREKYSKLYNEVLPKAAEVLYNEGIKLYNSKDYQGAVNKLSKVELYNKDFRYLDRALYTLGKCYADLNDSRNAVNTFTKVVAEFPNTQYATYSQNRINQLTRLP